jgi:hypothetical protein
MIVLSAYFFFLRKAKWARKKRLGSRLLEKSLSFISQDINRLKINQAKRALKFYTPLCFPTDSLFSVSHITDVHNTPYKLVVCQKKTVSSNSLIFASFRTSGNLTELREGWNCVTANEDVSCLWQDIVNRFYIYLLHVALETAEKWESNNSLMSFCSVFQF